MNANKYTVVLAGGAVVLGFYLYYQSKQTVREVGAAINPVNKNNIFKKSVDAVGGAVTQRDDFELGSWLYCKLNKDSRVCKSRY